MLTSLLLVFLFPLGLFANGILDRAHDQYFRRGYDEAGIKNADNARYNFGRVVERLQSIEGEYARARYLQATNFLILANAKDKGFYLQDGIGQAMQGLLFFQRKYGRNPLSHPQIQAREKKIFADLTYWRAEAFFQFKVNGMGGDSSEWKAILEDLKKIADLGYACLNEGGAYRILGQIAKTKSELPQANSYFQKAYACTFSKELQISWNGENNLNWAESLILMGQAAKAVVLLETFIQLPIEKLSFELMPENRKAQQIAIELLKKLGRGQKVEAVPGQFVVQTKNRQTKSVLKSLEKFGFTVKEQMGGGLALVETLSPMEFQPSQLGEIQNQLGFSRWEPNFIYRTSAVPNDPLFAQSWGFENRGQFDFDGRKGLEQIDVRASQAWNISTGSEKVIVAVVDTGVDFSSDDLKANQWFNQAELNGASGQDDDQNGYIDDISGFDFVRNQAMVVDDNGHGTHVAGIIGARGNNHVGIAGVVWQVQIMPLKFIGAGGTGDLASAIKAIRYATRMGAQVMNNSWGSGNNSEILKQVIQEASDQGIVFVAAAGNSGRDADLFPEYPAAYDLPDIISVTSIGNRGQLSDFSNFGASSVHIAAPGENILSTVPQGFQNLSGTSMAAPFVSGAAALLLAENPHMSAVEIKKRLLQTAAPMQSLTSKVKSGGRLDLYGALINQAQRRDPYDPEAWQYRTENFQLGSAYLADLRLEHRFEVPEAKYLSLYFSHFNIEKDFDKLLFTDCGQKIFARWTGTRAAGYSAIFSGESVCLKFISDSVVDGNGFQFNKVLYQ